MKFTFAILFTSSLLYSELPEEIPVETEEKTSAEILLFDPPHKNLELIAPVPDLAAAPEIAAPTPLSTPSLVETASPEIAILAPPSLIQQPISTEELQFPPSPTFTPPRKSPGLAVTLSTFVPGLGHVYLGDMKTAGGLFGTTTLGVGVASYSRAQDSIRFSSLITAQSSWFYSIYAAYRDARLYNKQAGYAYKMPTDSLADLTLAPFRWSVLEKPEVWGGFLGAIGIAVGTAYFVYSKEAHAHLNLSSRVEYPLIALPVGIGEESFFRGYLQSMLSEFCTPWGGIALSSLAFGAVHIPNALALDPQHRWRYYSFSLPLITGMGVYLGWVAQKNHSLKESVALHVWYDFAVFAAASLATQSAAVGHPQQFALALPF